MGSLRSLQHKTEEALQYTEKAVAFYRQSGYHKWLALTLPLLGRAYRDRGNYQAALKAFEDQLKFGEQLGDQAQVGLADVDIGNLLLYEEQYPKALSRFDESCGIFKSLKAELYAAYAAQSRASVLWQLGRSEEARAALEEATATAEQAERPKDIYKQLLADIYLTSALLELSQGNLHESKVKSRKALGLSGNQYPAIAVQATDTLALAHARSGAARAAELLSKEAIDIAAGMNDPQLLSGALLASAEALLDNGKAQAALEAALRAQESFARYGKSDSEWRAWLIGAEASRQLRNDPAAREYASFAKAGLSMLEQKWGAEVYQNYLARSDITRFRKQLEQVVKK
jgi:tetratricopeptide (TPR) repeat protein